MRTSASWLPAFSLFHRRTVSQKGFEFQALPSGNFRFNAQFRVPRSEFEAIELYGRRERERGAERTLFCDIGPTLRQLQRSGIRRLSSWPVASVIAWIEISGKRRELALNVPSNWTSGGEVLASAELTEAEYKRLHRDLDSPLGAPVNFVVSNQWRRTGCVQRIELDGVEAIDAFGLRDGERGAVSLDALRFAVRGVISRNTNVNIDGECGAQSIMLPSGSVGGQTDVNCSRSGKSLECLFEGQFVLSAFKFQTHEIIGNGVAGVF